MIDTIIGVAFIVGVGYVLYKMVTRKETVQEAVKETIAEAKVEVAKAADINNDGKVDIKDAIVAVEKTTEVVKKTATKAKAAAKKTTKKAK